MLKCPECKTEMVKNGKRRTKKGLSQRWICPNCGRNKYTYIIFNKGGNNTPIVGDK